MQPISVIIIDDEQLARGLIKEYLQELPHVTILAECENGFEGVKAIAMHKPDLIFLDVQMPKLNGFEMLELLDDMPQVIFTTAFQEYAIKAFESSALDYLLKPFSQARLTEAVNKCVVNKKNAEPIKTFEVPTIPSFQTPRVVVKDNHQIHIIPFADLKYLEAADDYVKLHTTARYFLKKKTLTYFETALPANEFCRVHRSYIIALNEIHKVEPYEKDGAIVTLKNKAEIPVSKAGYVKLKVVLGV
jgi:two-component system, LytTR family, response regulator